MCWRFVEAEIVRRLPARPAAPRLVTSRSRENKWRRTFVEGSIEWDAAMP
jgi:hypothetical protein